VLLAYSKIWLYDELLGSTLPDDPWVSTALERYFRSCCRTASAATCSATAQGEIIATHVTNSMINRVAAPSCIAARDHRRACLRDRARVLLSRESSAW